MAGAVKSNKIKKSATSDWMEIEKQRGISVATSVMGFDYKSALKSITVDANKGLMFDDDKRDIVRRRPVARVIFGIVLISILVCGYLVWTKEKAAKKSKTETLKNDSSKMFRFVPWMFLAPAIISIALWSYYPLIRGAIMAFQDYKPMLGVAGSPWVGFDHFAAFFNSVNFFRLLKNTLTISVVSLLFGFPAP